MNFLVSNVGSSAGTYIGSPGSPATLTATSSASASVTVHTNNVQDNVRGGAIGTNNDKTGYKLDVTDTTAIAVSTNLDARVSTRSTYSGGVVLGVTNPVTVGTNNDKTGYKLASDGIDAITIETGVNARQALSIHGAASGGNISGITAGTGTQTVLVSALNNSGTTRISASTDQYGNRVITLTLPA